MKNESSLDDLAREMFPDAYAAITNDNPMPDELINVVKAERARRSNANRFPVHTICGSMRYASKMQQIAQQETSNGVIILMPFVSDYVGAKPADERKRMLDEMHRVKIDMSDAIIVVGMHIGESTTSEIEYAKSKGKDVLYWTDHFGPIP